MFGQFRLSKWMESHLGRPRHKSTSHQNPKQQRAPKDSSASASSSSSTTTNNTTTPFPSNSSSSAVSSTSISGNSYPVSQFLENNSNLESSSSSEFSSTSPSCSNSVQAQSDSVTAQQHQKQQQQRQVESLKDREEKIQQSTCTRSSTTGSVSNITSNSILLGSFSNNLSSPDTGYSTDGYSPKSVYPALSFESSGKSTPKSSYTISSLVSSELLTSSKNTSISSASCSVQNGLELDECLSPVSLAPQPLPETDIDSIDRIPKGDSSTRIQHEPPSHSINHELTVNLASSSSQDRCRGNDTVTTKQCNSSLSVSHIVIQPSHGKNIMVAPTPNLSNFSNAQSHKNDNGSCKLKDFCRLSNPLKNYGISSPPPDNNRLIITNHHRRAESMDERKSTALNDGGASNSSSMLTGANRNIRTSFVLATSQIPECNTSGLKNAFSICSPRRERTRIKTNPWITISQQNNDGNSNANIESNSNSGGRSKQNSPPTVRETTRMEKANFHHPGVSVTHNIQTNHTGVSCEPSKTILEINNRDETDREGMDTMDHHPQPDHESSSLVYRISTSTSASDSGKGSLEPGTNRNSTESSSLLSDSTASTRNSIISHEAVPGCSESRSRSSSSTTTDTFNNGHGVFFSTTQVESTTEEQQPQSHQCTATVNIVSVSSVKSTPTCTSKSGAKVVDLVPLVSLNNDSHLSEQDLTTSITLPPELISARAKTIMETEILSDWANTDEDGEDEIETDQNDNDAVTPTPSSPDTDTGGRAIFPNSHSTSSATDIDFGDSTATTASSTCIFPDTSSVIRHHYSQNINKHSNGVAPSPYHHNMNLPTTCYQPIPIIPTPGIPDMYAQERKDAYWNQSEPLVNHVLIHQPSNVTLGGRCPSPGIPMPNISLSSLYPHPLDPDYNVNKSSSHAIARGALGFLRKIFKKGSCSAQRTSPGSDKLKGKGKDNHHYIPSATGLRSPLLTADALVSPHPLGNRKTSLNGYFLTPTPNAFRRRSGTGTDSSDSKSSKHHKSVKTDIIRLPLGTLSPNQGIMQTSSSSTSSSQNTGAFCVSSFQNTIIGINSGQSNTNTNSTSASSVHSMSTSTSAASVGATGVNANHKTPRQNQSRLNDNLYSNSNTQSPFMSHQQNVGYAMSPKSTGIHSSIQTKPQLPLVPPVAYHSHPSNITSQSHIIQHQRDFPSHPSTTKGTPNAGPCPYESPRLQNSSAHRINSPSFNNYSPIHRLVVTAGSHLHTRGPPNPSSHLIQIHSASSYNPESPILASRNGNTALPSPSYSHHTHSHNNNPTFTPVINRSHLPIPTSTPSPLINHRQQSISSPHPIHPSSNASYVHPGSNSFASPSPILRNPRYQYIASSNQNSPVLNVPKRINLPAPQHYPHHNHGAPLLPSNPNGPPPFSTFSPVPPPRQNSNNNPFSAASPNLNHQQYPQARHRSGSLGCEFENANTPNLPGTTSGNGNIVPSSTTSNRSNIISRSQSYQAHQIHYYASPVPQPPQRMHPPIPNSLPSGFQNEPPLLMRTHLHNQNIRLNNFLQNKQKYRHQQSRGERFPNSGSFQERIYETVDSEEEEDGDISDDEDIDPEDNNIGIRAQNEQPMRNKSYKEYDDHGERNMCTMNRVGPESGFQFTHKNSNSRTQQSWKSRTSKPQQSDSSSQSVNFQPRPPVPMALFGPNTFLSETETRLLESDREADRKYKRLINEAEALLREISAVKSQQPWAHHDQERLRADDCPQSDPLRRKAYDCWALRRLQQELAGCCASPPVLHRSRMNLQSPSTPTGASQPYFIPNLSLAHEPSSSLIPTNSPIIDNNRNNAHF